MTTMPIRAVVSVLGTDNPNFGRSRCYPLEYGGILSLQYGCFLMAPHSFHNNVGAIGTT